MNDFSFQLTESKIREIAFGSGIDLSERESKQCLDFFRYTNAYESSEIIFRFMLAGFIKEWWVGLQEERKVG